MIKIILTAVILFLCIVSFIFALQNYIICGHVAPVIICAGSVYSAIIACIIAMAMYKK